MKNSIYNFSIIIVVILAIIASIIILWCLSKHKDNFKIYSSGKRGGRDARRGRGGRSYRKYRKNKYFFPRRVFPRWDRRNIYYNVYESPPTNYGNCKCEQDKIIKNKCLYGNPSCDDESCICGKNKYWGCDNNSGEWCENK